MEVRLVGWLGGQTTCGQEVWVVMFDKGSAMHADSKPGPTEKPDQAMCHIVCVCGWLQVSQHVAGTTEALGSSQQAASLQGSWAGDGADPSKLVLNHNTSSPTPSPHTHTPNTHTCLCARSSVFAMSFFTASSVPFSSASLARSSPISRPLGTESGYEYIRVHTTDRLL